MNNLSLRQGSDTGIRREILCTRFFGLVPCGWGTGLHESLPSYLDRLAKLHSVRNGPFFLNEIHPKPVSSSGSLLAKHSRGMLLGSGWAERIALCVAASTGVPEVHALVQSNLSQRLSWYKNTRPKAAWCPDCLAAWAQKGSPIYRPLVWSLTSVRSCPVHHVVLQERCPNCSHEFDHFGPVSWSPFCPNCGHALFSHVSPDKKGDELVSEYDRFCSSRVSDILNWGLRFSADDLPPDWFFVNIRNALAELKSEYALARLTGLSRAVIQKWRHSHGRPLLPALLRLSYCFDIPLNEWVSRSIPRELFNRCTVVPKGVSTFQTYASRPTRKSIQRALLAHLGKPIANPLSVRELAKVIGTNSCRLYEVCPSLTARVVARRARHLAQQKKRSAHERVQLVRQAIAELRANGRQPSRNAVLAILTSRGVKCSWLLKAIFRREIQSPVSDTAIPD